MHLRRALLGLFAAAGLVICEDSQGTVTVDLASQRGEPAFLASGFIYGWPSNGVEADSSIPYFLVEDMKFRTCRAGGAQLTDPALGWAVGGYDGYKGRFESTLSNYRSTRKYGGDFILLPHDLWGADGGLGGGIYPGDDGDWSEMESFYDQLIDDIVANDMLDGLVIDLWNEPELDIFWAREWDQYLDYFVRAHDIVRAKLPQTLISGPSGAHSPSLDSDTWNRWMARIAESDAIPDIYSWHQIGAWEREPDTTIPEFNTLRDTYGLPVRPIDINEYAWPDEQNPANTAWFIAQLERHDLRGLRANWARLGTLHDFMADLVFKGDDGNYYPNGEWYIYEYYGRMTGQRVTTSASDNIQFDAYGTISDDGAKVITGTRTIQAPYEIQVKGISALGLPTSGSISVRTREFVWAGNNEDPYASRDLGANALDYNGDTLTILVDPSANTTAYAYELLK